MKKKKLLATVLASALACGTLSGCGGTAQTSGSATSSDGSGKTVKVFQLKVEINDALQKLAQEYEKEKGVKVEITSVGGGADYGASLKAEFQRVLNQIYLWLLVREIMKFGNIKLMI